MLAVNKMLVKIFYRCAFVESFFFKDNQRREKEGALADSTRSGRLRPRVFNELVEISMANAKRSTDEFEADASMLRLVAAMRRWW